MRGHSNDGKNGRNGEGGSALVIVVVTVLVAAALAAALVVTASSQVQNTKTQEQVVRAMAVAEAGLDRGIAEANLSANRTKWASWRFDNKDGPTVQTDGSYAYADTTRWPAAGGTTLSTANSVVLDDNGNTVGTFTVVLKRGDEDGVDNDGDGVTDLAGGDLDEHSYLTVSSTGYPGTATNQGFSVNLMAQIEFNSVDFNIQAGVFVQDPSSIVKLGSSSVWTIDGFDNPMTSGGTVANPVDLPAIMTTGSSLTITAIDVIGEPSERFGLGGTHYAG
ncbi:MAG: hypothetical protein ACYTDX_05715, partial [Planctomycetota bacterium]